MVRIYTLSKNDWLGASLAGSLWARGLTVFNKFVPAELLQGKDVPLFYTCGFVLVCSLLLGGGTRGGFLSDAVLQLLAVPALLLSLSTLIELAQKKGATIERQTQWMLTICSAVLLCPLLQLVPLPPWLWTRLPGGEEILAVVALVGDRLPWMPISVSPNDTWMSFLSLLPPAAIFLGVIQLGYRGRRRLSLIILAVGVISVFVGLAQVSQGPSSPLRFFAFTNSTEPVGFFANRNHFAALLYTLLLLAAVWAIDIALKVESWADPRMLQPVAIVALVATLLAIVGVIAGEAMTRSRAGLVLTMVALIAVFALALRDRRGVSGMTPSKLLFGATMLSIILAVQFTLYRILERFTSDPLVDARIPFARNTIRAAISFMPFGSGFGTFVPVYAMFEKPSDALPDIYANHAHNDILESWLESGIVGPLLLGVFVIWVGLRASRYWRRPPAHASELDHALVRAATIAIGLLLAHSLVDYPLRTGAMMAVFAFFCALLVEPLAGFGAAATAEAEPMGERVARRPPTNVPDQARTLGPALGSRVGSAGGTGIGPALLPQEGALWGEDIDWPEEWRKSSNEKRPDND